MRDCHVGQRIPGHLLKNNSGHKTPDDNSARHKTRSAGLEQSNGIYESRAHFNTLYVFTGWWRHKTRHNIGKRLTCNLVVVKMHEHYELLDSKSILLGATGHRIIKVLMTFFYFYHEPLGVYAF